MASITSKTKGKYTKKESSSELTQVFLETLDSQVVFENDIILNGITYHKQGVIAADTAFDKYGRSLADILAIIGSSGGKYRLIAGATANIVKLQTSTDGGSVWTDVSTITINNVANATNATNATNVALSATGSGTDSISIKAGTGTAASFVVDNVANASNASNVDLTVTGTGTASIVIQAGSGTSASFTVNNVANATKATQDASGNVITTTYATKTELAEIEAGVTRAYVTTTTDLTGSDFEDLIQTKTASQRTATIDNINPNADYSSLGFPSKASDLNVGDTIYIKNADVCDWFIANIQTGTSANTIKIEFVSIEADMPTLDGYVTGTSLTANKIVLGNGDSAVKSSSYSIVESSTTTSQPLNDTYVPTLGRVDTIVSNYIGSLDVNNITGFGAGKTLATLTETDGKIAATFQDISITKSQISDFPTGFTITVTDGLLNGTGGVNSVKYEPYTTAGAGHLYTGTANPTNTNRLNYDGYFYATKLYSGGAEVLTSHASISGTAPINVVQDTQTGEAVITHNTSGITAGTYSAVQVNTYGHVTAGAQIIKYVASESADVSDVAIGGTVVVVGSTVNS